ncbi:MAG: glycosyltransferase [Candidatus Omnitrophica bacterium]|nr:glycosyltransferase [Candidatus Omnitrophota bacterium]
MKAKKEQIPKISVILTAHNYAQFLKQAIDSVLRQTCQDFELIVIDDASVDHTREVLSGYSSNSQIRILYLGGVGLAAACNAGIKESKGKYIIRLDADDYFDENILLVASSILDAKPDVHLVYSDYYRVDEKGAIIDHYKLMKSNDELELLDRAPLGAGLMYRRLCYDEIGGYNEKLKFQEDYDFWVRFIHRFKVYNVRLPLMYYRKHDGSMSTNIGHRLIARRYVKHDFIDKNVTNDKKIAGFIRESVFFNKNKIALKEINGYPLIYYSINALKGCGYISDVFISTDDSEVERIAQSFGAKSLGLHSKALASPSITRGEVVDYHLKELNKNGLPTPDILATVSAQCPLIKPHHITEAIDTMLMHNYDSVISVMEHYDFYWRPGARGLIPFGFDRKLMKEDSDTLYLETGGIRVVKTNNLLGNNWLGNSTGFIELAPKETISVDKDEFSLWLVSQIMKNEH